MVQCPKCGKEVPFDEYEAHWDSCKGETRDIKLLDGTTRNVTLDELKVILRHDDPIMSVYVIEAIWNDAVDLPDILEQYETGKLYIPKDPKREEEEKILTGLLMDKILTPFQEMQEEQAKKLGYKSVKDYEIHKEIAFANDNTFEGVIIYPMDQVQIIGDFSWAVEFPEAKPPGMDDPIDFGLANYLPIIRKEGVFVGFGNLKPEYQQERFPSGIYANDYKAFKKLLTDNGWVYDGKNWSRAS